MTTTTLTVSDSLEYLALESRLRREDALLRAQLTLAYAGAPDEPAWVAEDAAALLRCEAASHLLTVIEMPGAEVAEVSADDRAATAADFATAARFALYQGTRYDGDETEADPDRMQAYLRLARSLYRRAGDRGMVRRCERLMRMTAVA